MKKIYRKPNKLTLKAIKEAETFVKKIKSKKGIDKLKYYDNVGMFFQDEECENDR